MNDHRIRVTTSTHATIGEHREAVTIVGISARTALVVTTTAPTGVGSTMTLSLPTLHGDIEVLAGIDAVEKVPQGFAVAVAFIVVDQETRTALNELMTLLLSGDGGGARAHPRVIYDVAIRHGPTLSMYGRLEDLSLRGASVRINERMLPDSRLRFDIPDFATENRLVFTGRVVQQRLSKEGGYHTGVELVDVDPPLRARLARLLADLLCR